MNRKITWAEVYKDFKSRLPNLSKGAVEFRPYGFMTIIIYLRDGTRMLYDGMQKRAWFIDAA